MIFANKFDYAMQAILLKHFLPLSPRQKSFPMEKFALLMFAISNLKRDFLKEVDLDGNWDKVEVDGGISE